jgi:hypothetical protein
MIHYHGTPITPRQPAFYELAGRFFCVSYAAPGDLAAAHEVGQGVMLDNGAFTAWTRGAPVKDWDPYYRWVEPWLDYWTTWAVIPDVIDGDETANDRLVSEWPHGDRGAPVWHLHESLDRLARLADEWPLVCLGSSGAYRTVASPAWHARMSAAMDVACDENGRPRTRLHMLRGLDLSDGPYPFYSADSTNVARNHGGAVRNGRPRRSPGRMAADIDARQPVARWKRISYEPLALDLRTHGNADTPPGSAPRRATLRAGPAPWYAEPRPAAYQPRLPPTPKPSAPSPERPHLPDLDGSHDAPSPPRRLPRRPRHPPHVHARAH